MNRIILLLIFASPAHAIAAEPATGPVIQEYGPVYYVPETTISLPPGIRWKAVFDVSATPEEPDKLNYRLETVARYLNMHARAGLDPDRLDVAVVLHGKATRTALSGEAFQERYGHGNPDGDIVSRLAAAGVRFFVCGQSAAGFGFRPEELAPEVTQSLSALTALVSLQSRGYALIPWGTD
jgi:intracellular sulfur oxidation DsrE/DsrF family protein